MNRELRFDHAAHLGGKRYSEGVERVVVWELEVLDRFGIV